MGSCCSAPSQRGSLASGTASVKIVELEAVNVAVAASGSSTKMGFQEHKAQLLAAIQQEHNELASSSEGGNDRPGLRAPWRLPKKRAREVGKVRPWYVCPPHSLPFSPTPS